MAEAAGDAAIAANSDAATRPILSFMMYSSACATQDIEEVLIKLWRGQNVMLMNKSSALAAGSLIPAGPGRGNRPHGVRRRGPDLNVDEQADLVALMWLGRRAQDVVGRGQQGPRQAAGL
jgi:hypothetical protein